MIRELSKSERDLELEGEIQTSPRNRNIPINSSELIN
jgi:hypothetical protein